jgi:hypothetical protein
MPSRWLSRDSPLSTITRPVTVSRRMALPKMFCISSTSNQVLVYKDWLAAHAVNDRKFVSGKLGIMKLVPMISAILVLHSSAY